MCVCVTEWSENKCVGVCMTENGVRTGVCVVCMTEWSKRRGVCV